MFSLSPFFVPIARCPAAVQMKGPVSLKFHAELFHNIEALKAHGKFNILLHLMEGDKNYMQNILYIHFLEILQSYSFPVTNMDLHILISIFRNTKDAHGVLKQK